MNHEADKDSGAPPEHEVNGGSPGGDVQVPTVRGPDERAPSEPFDFGSPVAKTVGVGVLLVGPVIGVVAHFIGEEAIENIAEDLGLAESVPAELTRRQAAMLDELRAGKDVVARSASEARRLLEHSHLKPFTSQSHLPASPAPRGTYRGTC